MTRDQWLALRVGDVIVERRSMIQRRILKLHRVAKTGYPVKTWISLRKIRDSWTSPENQFTSYSTTDDQPRPRGRWMTLEDLLRSHSPPG